MTFLFLKIESINAILSCVDNSSKCISCLSENFGRVAASLNISARALADMSNDSSRSLNLGREVDARKKSLSNLGTVSYTHLTLPTNREV